MHRFGKGFMFVSALLWVVAGAIVFTSPRSGDPPRVAHVIGTQVASANAAIPTAISYENSYPSPAGVNVAVESTVADGSTNNPWEGPYYVNNQAPSVEHQADVVQMQVKPWYTQYFGGIGTMFHDLFSVESASSYGVSASQMPVPTKQMPPACTISIIPNSVPYGGSATVSWTSRNADHVVFQGVGEVARSGSIPVKQLTSTRALALAVVGAQGLSSSCYTVVNVEPVIVDPLTCVISGNPSVINAGETVNLSWGSENAATATLQDQGPVAVVSGTTVAPAKTTTYTLNVESVLGDRASCDTTVTVN